MRALLIGAGSMGKAWARNLKESPKTKLVGWVDILDGAAGKAAHELGEPLDYAGTSLKDGVKATDPDFVVDVSAPAGHYQVTVEALSLGLPVLGEKPMATTLEEASKMIEASERSGKLYMVSQSRRYDGGLVAYRKMIEEKIGKPEVLNVDFYIGARFGGFRAEMESPLLLDMAIHTFDQARFLTGADPVTVYAEEFNPSWSWYKGAACANCLFEMSNGLRYAYRGSWCSEGLNTSWEGSWRAVGPNGTVRWVDSAEPFAETLPQDAQGFIRSGDRSTDPRAQITEGIAGSLEEFLRALETGTTPQGECHDNVKSLAMVLAAIESSRRGERVLVGLTATDSRAPNP